MKIWVVESRPKQRFFRDDEWMAWGEVDFLRAMARHRARLLKPDWPEREFRVRAYQRVEGSK